MTQRYFIGSLLVVAIALSPNPASAQEGPKETVEAANTKIRELLRQPPRKGGAAAARRDEQLKTIVSSLLDIDYMAEKALGRRWAKRTPEERTQYLALMKQLVERSYLRQARGQGDYEIQFGRVTMSRQGQAAEVESILRVTKQGRHEEVELIYSLQRRSNVWRVTDVETDGASTVRNYRAQFGRIIQQKGFSELLDRMRRRVAQGEANL